MQQVLKHMKVQALQGVICDLIYRYLVPEKTTGQEIAETTKTEHGCKEEVGVEQHHWEEDWIDGRLAE